MSSNFVLFFLLTACLCKSCLFMYEYVCVCMCELKCICVPLLVRVNMFIVHVDIRVVVWHTFCGLVLPLFIYEIWLQRFFFLHFITILLPLLLLLLLLLLLDIFKTSGVDLSVRLYVCLSVWLFLCRFFFFLPKLCCWQNVVIAVVVAIVCRKHVSTFHDFYFVSFQYY